MIIGDNEEITECLVILALNTLYNLLLRFGRPIHKIVDIYNLPPRIFLPVKKPLEHSLTIGLRTIRSIIDLDTLGTVMDGLAVPCYTVRCIPG